MKKLIYIIPLFLIFSCVPRSNYNEILEENKLLREENQKLQVDQAILQNENEQLNSKIQLLQSDLAYINNSSQQTQANNQQVNTEVKSNKKYYSEENALTYINDYFDFYKSDLYYRNVRLRRINNNSFEVALETCTKKANFSNDDFFWIAGVYELTIENNGTYNLICKF